MKIMKKTRFYKKKSEKSGKADCFKITRIVP